MNKCPCSLLRASTRKGNVYHELYSRMLTTRQAVFCRQSRPVIYGRAPSSSASNASHGGGTFSYLRKRRNCEATNFSEAGETALATRTKRGGRSSVRSPRGSGNIRCTISPVGNGNHACPSKAFSRFRRFPNG